MNINKRITTQTSGESICVDWDDIMRLTRDSASDAVWEQVQDNLLGQALEQTLSDVIEDNVESSVVDTLSHSGA